MPGLVKGNFAKIMGGYESVLLGVVATSVILFASPYTEPGHVAISVAYSLSIPSLLAFVMQMKMMVAMFMLSLERFTEYQSLQSEPAWRDSSKDRKLEEWPASGGIKFESRFSSPFIRLCLYLGFSRYDELSGRAGSCTQGCFFF